MPALLGTMHPAKRRRSVAKGDLHTDLKKASSASKAAMRTSHEEPIAKRFPLPLATRFASSLLIISIFFAGMVVGLVLLLQLGRVKPPAHTVAAARDGRTAFGRRAPASRCSRLPTRVRPTSASSAKKKGGARNQKKSVQGRVSRAKPNDVFANSGPKMGRI